ncbi:MAG: TadE/TadG family type IV pilus assembly protein [Thermoguttaceae bacterium]
MSRRRRSSSNDRGAAAVEFAIVAPVLALLLVIALDYARVFYDTVTLWNCARQGGLYMSNLNPTAQSPYANVTAAAQADSGNLSTQPTVTSSTGTLSGLNSATVTTTWSFSTITDYPGVGGTVSLSRSVQMPVFPNAPD